MPNDKGTGHRDALHVRCIELEYVDTGVPAHLGGGLQDQGALVERDAMRCLGGDERGC